MKKDFLSSVAEKMQQASCDMKKISHINMNNESVIKMNPVDVANWEYRDRQDFELGDIDELAESIELNGQAQPIIIVEKDHIFRSVNECGAKYIVIAGYRRWLACKSKNIFVESIIRNMSIEQAIACLISENQKEQVSDYSKGMFYYQLLNNEKITKKTLSERIGLKRGMFDNYISFAEVPREIWDAVGDLRNVSARTSSTIKLLAQKGPEYKQALVSIAGKISEGIGEKKIMTLVNMELNKTMQNKKIGNSTRVEFSNSIYMDSKKNQIKLSLKNLDENEVETLKNKISKVLEDFVQETI